MAILERMPKQYVSPAWAYLALGMVFATGLRAEIPKLILEKALPIVADRALEPSGLALREGLLYSVTDERDDMIYRLELAEDHARWVEHRSVHLPAEIGLKLDLEGLTALPDGGFVLASERRCRLIQVSTDGHASWLGPDMSKVGRKAGLLNKKNGAVEGACRLPDGSWLALGERAERGLLWMKPDPSAKHGYTLEAWRMPLDAYASRLPIYLPADYSDLSADGNRVFIVARNQGLVIQLERGQVGQTPWVEGRAWSFREIEEQHAYLGALAGQVEGLAVSGQMVWLVVDPNGLSRKGSGDDRRALLFVCRFP